MGEYIEGVTFNVEDCPTFRQFWKKVYKRGFRLIYRPTDLKIEIEWIADAVYILGDVTFLIEEIDAVCTPYDIHWTLQQIIQRGRHKNIRLIGVTPAPFGIHRNLTRQAKDIFVFNTKEPRDLQYLRGLLGQAVEAPLIALEQYEFLHWQDGEEGFKIGKVNEDGKNITYRNRGNSAGGIESGQEESRV